MTNRIKVGTKPVCDLKVGTQEVEEVRVGKQLVYRNVDTQWGFGYHSKWFNVYTLNYFNNDNSDNIIDKGDWWELEIVNLPSTAQNIYFYLQEIGVSYDYNRGNNDSLYLETFDNRINPYVAILDCNGKVLVGDTVQFQKSGSIYYDPEVHGDTLRFRIYKVNNDSSESNKFWLYFIVLPEGTSGTFIDRYKMLHTNADEKEKFKAALKIDNLESSFQNRGIFFISNNPTDSLDYTDGSHFIVVGMLPDAKYRVTSICPNDSTQVINVNRYDIFNGNSYIDTYDFNVGYTVPEANDFSGTRFWELLRIYPSDKTKSMKFIIMYDFNAKFNNDDTAYEWDFPHQIEFISLPKFVNSLNVSGSLDLEKYYSHKLLDYTGGLLNIIRMSRTYKSWNPSASSSYYTIDSDVRMWYSIIEVDSNGEFVRYLKRFGDFSNYASLNIASIGSGNYAVLRRGAVSWSEHNAGGYEYLICGKYSSDPTNYIGWKLSDDGINYGLTLDLHYHLDIHNSGTYYFKHSSSVNQVGHYVWLPLYLNGANSITINWNTNNCDIEVNIKDREGNQYAYVSNGDTINVTSSIDYCLVGIKLTNIANTPYDINFEIQVL